MTNENANASVADPADETWSEDLTAALLFAEITKIEADLADIAKRRESFALKISACDAATEQKTRHLRALLAFQAMMRGEFVGIHPRDVRSTEGQLGLKIGPLLIGATSADVPTKDLQYFEATLREIYQQATHQVRLINDIIRAREQAATEQTSGFPVIPPRPGTSAPPDGEDIPWSQLVGRYVRVQLKTGLTADAMFKYFGVDTAVFHDMQGQVIAEPLVEDIAWIQAIEPWPPTQPAEVSDAVVASPSVTQPDGQVTE